MATRQTAAIAILTDYTQAEEDAYAAVLLAAGEHAGNYIFNTDIPPVGNIRVWNGSAFENTTPIPPLLVPLATNVVQGGIPPFGSALQIMRVNAAGDALEFSAPAGSSGGTPFFIPSGTTFNTNQYQQSVASLAIDSEGVIDVSNGVLIFTK